MARDFLTLLSELPGSYAGPTRPLSAPYSVVGAGEGALAASLLSPLIASNFARSGTQLILFSPDAADAARVYSELAEVAGAAVRRISTGGLAQEVETLVPGGALATYHFAQAAAYATDHAADAEEAERVLRGVAEACGPQAGDTSPARLLAWELWGRAPLLLAAPEAEGVLGAWQQLLARVGKSLAVPVLGDPLPFVTGAFEARHEVGDGRVAVLLGDLDPALTIAREVLESRVDELHHVPAPQTGSPYAAGLGLWYFGAWVAFYLAERYGLSPSDPPVLPRAQAALTGEEAERGDLS